MSHHFYGNWESIVIGEVEWQARFFISCTIFWPVDTFGAHTKLLYVLGRVIYQSGAAVPSAIRVIATRMTSIDGCFLPIARNMCPHNATSTTSIQHSPSSLVSLMLATPDVPVRCTFFHNTLLYATACIFMALHFLYFRRMDFCREGSLASPAAVAYHLPSRLTYFNN